MPKILIYSMYKDNLTISAVVSLCVKGPISVQSLCCLNAHPQLSKRSTLNFYISNILLSQDFLVCKYEVN